MLKIGAWSVFLAGFVLVVVGILSLGWWTGPETTPTPVARKTPSSASKSAAMRHLNCQTRHWRMLLLQR